MKLYIISGLGADDLVFERITFNPRIEIVHIPWLVPIPNETFQNYVNRMSESIDCSQEFYLLGYSFGGLIAQEIHKIKPSKKIVILGSIRSDKEKSKLIKIGEKTGVLRHIPLAIFNHKNAVFYAMVRKLFDPKNPTLLRYFRVKNPYYIKWSVEKITQWKFERLDDVIQILADRDIVFPLKNSNPDFVIKNATHLFPVTKYREVSKILKEIFV